MFRFIKQLALYFGLWFILFILSRVIFLIYHLSQTRQLKGTDTLNTFLYGFRLDMSMSAYICILPFVLWSIAQFFNNKKLFISLLKIYTNVFITLISILSIVDMELYGNWGFRLDNTFLKYLKSPKEMLASSGTAPIFLLFTIGITLIISIFYTFKKIFFEKIYQEYQTDTPLSIKGIKTISGLLLSTFLIVPIRGGFQLTPINQSNAYFSNITFANHAALNGIWNFMVTTFEKNRESRKPYLFTEPNRMFDIVNNTLLDSSQTFYLIKKDIKTPNIIIITWESLTAKALNNLGGEKGILPHLDSLCKEGILFKNIYATGDRTHLGLMGILGGQPSIAGENILEFPSKALKLPILSRNLKEKGYETGFYYGGEAQFANMQSYLVNGQFTKLVTINNFDKKDLSSKWGAFDHVMLRRGFSDLKTYKQPFFVNLFMLSSHEPFEVPEGWGMPNFKATKDQDDLFRNVLFYTDQAVAEFIEAAKKETWWQNTLVVILGDHGTPRLPPHNDDIKRYHIPMLWLGGALAKKDTIISGIGSQTDVAATLLGQLDMPFKEYWWSKNILSKQNINNGWAYFALHNGLGWAHPKGALVWDTEGSFMRQEKGINDSTDLVKGKAFLQGTYGEFLKE